MKTFCGRVPHSSSQFVPNDRCHEALWSVRPCDQTTKSDEPGRYSQRTTRFERNCRKLKSGFANE